MEGMHTKDGARINMCVCFGANAGAGAVSVLGCWCVCVLCQGRGRWGICVTHELHGPSQLSSHAVGVQPALQLSANPCCRMWWRHLVLAQPR